MHLVISHIHTVNGSKTMKKIIKLLFVWSFFSNNSIWEYNWRQNEFSGHLIMLENLNFNKKEATFSWYFRFQCRLNCCLGMYRHYIGECC